MHMTLNFSGRDAPVILGNAKYPVEIITPKSTLARMDQIELFNHLTVCKEMTGVLI